MAIVSGKGTKLQLEIATVFTDIAQITGLTPPSMEMGTVETTHLLSTWREYVSTIPDAGEISFSIEYDPAHASHAALWTAFQGGAVESWKILLTDTGAASIEFGGILTGFSWDEVTVDGIVTASISVKLSGEITITP
jgi:predicted secreted protein